MSNKTVIDLSSFQSGMTLDQYKATGADYAIIKTTEGTFYTNPYIRTLIDRAAVQVKGFSFYHFGHFTNDQQARSEAEYFIKQTETVVHLKPGTLLTLDAEINGMPTSSVVAFLQVIRDHGYHTGFYTYKYLYPNFNWDEIKKVCDFNWRAAYILGNGQPYNGKPNFDYFPSAPDIDAWQYTDNLKGLHVDGSITVTDRADQLLAGAGEVKPAPQAQPVTLQPLTKNKQVPANSFVDDLGDRWYYEHGLFRPNQPINLRWGARVDSSIIMTIPAGQVIKYDAWSRHGGYVWIRQPRANGEYGYMVVRNANSNEAFGNFS